MTLLGLKIEQPGSGRQIALQGLVTQRGSSGTHTLGCSTPCQVPSGSCFPTPSRGEELARQGSEPSAKPLHFPCAQLQPSAPHWSFNGLSPSYFKLALIDCLAFRNFLNLKKETFNLFPCCLKKHTHSLIVFEYFFLLFFF